ncbi:hypothetical protein HY095_05415 [Candidatus Micrarchaeota archaeon]|nr:hypothetical protein [Candidatus Micrarchaeota archaeon]
MAKRIVCYTLGGIEPRKRLKFNHELYGFTDRSNNGKYEYKRKGILSGVRYEKPLDSVLVLPSANTRDIVKHLKKYRAKYINYPIQE